MENKISGDSSLGLEGLSTGLLEQYPLDLKVLSRNDNKWMLEGLNKRYALWDYRVCGKETDSVLECLEFLNINGCKSLPLLHKTQKGTRCIENNGRCIFLSALPKGDICDSTKNGLLQSLCSTLSEIHEKSAEWKGMSENNDEFGYIGKLQEILYELLQYKTVLEKKRYHSDFELIFLEYFDLIYGQGQESLEIMNMAGFGNPKIQKVFLINSFLPGSIIYVEQRCMFSDLHRICFGPRVKDLALLLRTLLPICTWDEQILKETIEVYERTKRLSFEERHVLIALLRFPGKYWLYALWYLRGAKSPQELALLLKNYILEWNMRDKSLDAIQTWLLGE